MRKSIKSKQNGQVLIVVLVLSAVLAVSLFSLYNIGQLTTNKQRLNDAADAAAFSGASVIAQGMNYTAYTNRATTVNNAMIAQMVSMRSILSMSQWYWKNAEVAWKAMSGITKLIPYVGAVMSKTASVAAKFSDIWGDKIIYATRRLAEVLTMTSTAAIGLTNQVMWAAQQVQIAESVGTFEPIVIQIAKDNAPDAKLDPVMHATFFGPITTLGTLAYNIEPTVRKSQRTLGTDKALDDTYMQFWTESNKNWHTPNYVGGRTLLPNAVGLWIATGCDVPSGTGMLTGLFEPNAGFGQPMDGVITAVQTFASLLSPIANELMCMFKRHGGSEMVQLKDGRLAWTAVDVMALDLPIVNLIPGMGHIPFAGGAATSFVDDDQVGKKYPESVYYFVDKMKRGQLIKGNEGTKKYFGDKIRFPADCMEILEPISGNYYAISTNTRTNGNCLVLGSGEPPTSQGKGIWGGKLKRTADKTLNTRQFGTDFSGIMYPTDILNDSLSDQLSNLDNASPTIAGGPLDQVGNIMPAGSSGLGDSASVTGLPNTANLHSQGEQLRSGLLSTASSMRQSFSNWRTLLDPVQMAHYSNRALMDTFKNSLTQGDNSEGGEDGGPGYWTKLLLKAIGAESVVALASLQVSDGIEYPKNKSVNKALKLLADGLPKWFWDVRVQKVVGGDPSPGDEYSLIVTDDDKQHNNVRRYGLGPLVFAPLILDTDRINTTEKLGIGGEITGLPDYKQKRAGLRSMGKARVFYSQAQNQWLNRFKLTILPTLFLPYWQVRNEGLSYADKWGTLVIDGVTGAYNDVPED